MIISKTQRIEWVDIAKGIGILLVILGHSVQFGGTFHNLIFSFHMPLFFLLSGIVYTYRENKRFIRKKAKSLFVPYVIFSIIGVVISILIPTWRSKLSIKAILKDIYLANPDAINVSSIWFLICLLLVSIMFNSIQKYDIKIQYFIVGICFIAGIAYSAIAERIYFLPYGRLPFNIDTSLVALLFFAIGVWCKKYVVNGKVFLASIVIFLFTFYCNGRVNLHGLTFNNPFLYILESVSGTVIVIFSCYILSMKVKDKIIVKRLKWLGRHSLIILGIQAILVRLYLLLVNMIENKQYYLYGFPKIHQVICFVSVTAFSIIICLVYDEIKVRIRRTNE